MSGLYALTVAQYGGAVCWVAPTYKNSRPLWRFCEMSVNPQHVQVHHADREILFPSGGRIGIYSAENDVSIRGEAFDLVIVDEAAQMKQETYTDVLLPTIADRDGRIMLISTPKGKNWFYLEILESKRTRRGMELAKHSESVAADSTRGAVSARTCQRTNVSARMACRIPRRRRSGVPQRARVLRCRKARITYPTRWTFIRDGCGLGQKHGLYAHSGAMSRMRKSGGLGRIQSD